jgi:hypothetical protein
MTVWAGTMNGTGGGLFSCSDKVWDEGEAVVPVVAYVLFGT